MLAKWLIRPDLESGRMRVVLADWSPPSVPVHVIYPTRRDLPPRTRAVMEFLLDKIRGDPEFAELWTT